MRLMARVYAHVTGLPPGSTAARFRDHRESGEDELRSAPQG
jgi:hypothetical protein